MCVGFAGASPDTATLAALRELGPCGVVLFARNVSDRDGTRTLVRAIEGALARDGMEPLICVDQEGGRVARLRFSEPLPTMLALAATRDAGLAERAGARLGRDLAEIGANLDFAPVLDLADAPAATAIGTRALGDDPHLVAELGAALVRGMQSVGVAAAAKHFPGHGESSLDPHVASPERERIRERDLVPFARAVAAGTQAIMSAHVSIAQHGDRPATLTPAILTTLLRDDLHFEGVAFTDCMQMDAVAKTVGTPRGAALALLAGADAVVVSHDLAVAAEARDEIARAIRSGELPRERLARAIERTRALRRDLTSRRPQREAARAAQPDDGIAHAIARASIVRVRGSATLPAHAPVAVVSFEGEASDGIARTSAERPSLSLALRRRRVRSELFRVALAPDVAMRDMLLEVLRAQRKDERRALVVMSRRAHLHAEQRELLAALFALDPQAIAVSVLEPFDVSCLAGARDVIATCGDDAASIEALADVLAANAPAPGVLPVRIPSLA